MTRYAVLLRGINLGAKRRVPMARLREVLGEAGFEDVETLLASGNVVLSSGKSEAAVVSACEKAIEAEFGFAVDCVVRTAAELDALVEADVLGGVADDPKKRLVGFLDAKPSREPDVPDVSPEAWEVAGREVHLWHPDGVGRSKGLGKLDWAKQLGVRTVTARNWATVLKLRDLAQRRGRS